jgi:hypothetical protein
MIPGWSFMYDCSFEAFLHSVAWALGFLMYLYCVASYFIFHLF